MKKIKTYNQLNESVDKGLKAHELWVVQKYGGEDIHTIYLNKDDAEKGKVQTIKEYTDYYRDINKNMSDDEYANYIKPVIDRIKVVTLDDAIYDKVSDAIDQATIYNEDY